MTQPPGGYPPPDPGEQHPPPADPFYAPPGWGPPTTPASQDPPTQPIPGQPSQPTQPIPPPPPYSPPPTGPYSVPPPPSGSPHSSQPTSPYLPPGSSMPYSYPPGPPPPRRRGPMIVAIVAAAALLVLGGGGIAAWLLTRDPDRNGAESPTVAVQSFLQAVYHDQDPAAASAMVCSEARDEAALETKINEIRSYQQTQVNPTFSWTEPAVVEEGTELAVVEVTVTMVTGDERTADQNLRVSVLDKDANGWWICDIQNVETPTTETPADASPSPTPTTGG
jgi:hypothetical protein